ncbi:MAG: hypothetical protein H6731_02385 [Myxococcales bacterium]|nr:MAG: hypothetical protein H6731_02385 [Myxococcales bacterium]
MYSLILIISGLLCSSIGNAQDYSNPQRSFTFSTAYAEKIFNSNEGLVDFPISALESYGALFDVATSSINKSWGARLLIATLELPLSYWFTFSLAIPFHEFGHARAAYAFGQNYSYRTQAFGKTVSAIPNYWLLGLARLITPPFFFPGTGSAWTSHQGAPRVNSKLSEYWGIGSTTIITSAAGLNNQSLFAKKIAHGIYSQRGHISQTLHYFMNKVSGFVYSLLDRRHNALLSVGSSDISAVIKGYQNKGYSITHGDIELQSLLSLISGTSYALLKGYYDYIAHGDARVSSPELFNVRIPDINSYINAKGLSLEFVSGYRFSDSLFFDVAYELIWKGEPVHQLTPMVRFDVASLNPSLNSLWLCADIVIAKGVGGSVSADWEPFNDRHTSFWRRFSYFAALYFHNGYSLYGERNISALFKENTSNFSGFAGLRLNY